MKSISCTRDLEDHTRLWLNTQGLTEELQNGTFLLALEWKNVTAGAPGIRLFPAVETNGGTLYLTDEATAQAQLNAPYYQCLVDSHAGQDKIQGNVPFIIPTNFWANLSSDQPVAHLLFDAVSRGSGQLVIAIYKNDGVTKIAESSQPLYLKLQDVKEMYERYTVGEDPSSAPATTASVVTSPYSYDSSIPAENNYILFVHGWNLATWEKDAFAETAFKRLYWQGYKGHFGEFRWPTATGDLTFDASESNAWASATGLLNKLDDLNAEYPGNVYLMAHSLGNVVAGEALKQAGSTQAVNTYIAMQAAIASHTYDANAPTRSLGIFDDNTPNRYAQYPTNGGACYFNGIAGAGIFVNFFNPVDYALESGTFSWELDQNTKPDVGYGYNDIDGFYRGILTTTLLYFPTNTYEIFAYCDEARCHALGAQADVGGVFSTIKQVDLRTIWPPDPFSNDYKDHAWHSGEFNFDNMQQANFWKTLLSSQGFGLK